MLSDVLIPMLDLNGTATRSRTTSPRCGCSRAWRATSMSSSLATGPSAELTRYTHGSTRIGRTCTPCVTPMFPATRGSAHRPRTAGTGWPACTHGNSSASPEEASATDARLAILLRKHTPATIGGRKRTGHRVPGHGLRLSAETRRVGREAKMGLSHSSRCHRVPRRSTSRCESGLGGWAGVICVLPGAPQRPRQLRALGAIPTGIEKLPLRHLASAR